MYCYYFDNRDYFCSVVFFYCFRLWLRFGGHACAYFGDVGKSGGYFCTAVELVLRAITMYRVRDGFDKETVILTTLGSIIGMLPGSWVLKVLPAAQLEVFLGAVLVAATILLSLQCTLPIKNKPADVWVREF